MFKYISNNEEETRILAYRLAEIIEDGMVISLNGEMGAGKTTFTQMFSKALNIDDYVTSPTFSLVNTYYGDRELNHLDLYRLEEAEEVESIDIDNYYYPSGITIVEWAERAKNYLPRDFIEIKIEKIDDNKREFTIEGRNRLEKKIIEGLY